MTLITNICMCVSVEEIRKLGSGLILMESDVSISAQLLILQLKEKVSPDCGVMSHNGLIKFYLWHLRMLLYLINGIWFWILTHQF